MKMRRKHIFNKKSRFMPVPYLLFAIGASIFFSYHSLARSADDYISRKTAVVQIMNKQSGRARTVELPVGGHVTEFEKLNIVVRSCKTTQPFAALDNFMFAEIEKNSRRIFSGWMTASAPGDNPLQDNEYDLWLVECK